MIAENLISDSIVPLKTSDTGHEALSIMGDFYIRHLPIVNNTELLGLLSEDDVLNNDIDEAVGSYSLSLPHIKVHTNDHIYEIMRLLVEYGLTTVPVVDEENNYKGLITQEDVLRFFAEIASFSDPGSIIVLEMTKRDYSLAAIARIVESESARILSAFVSSHPNSEKIDITLKVNKQQIQNLIASFNRFDFTVKASFNETEYVDSLQERYDSLLSYLNV